MSADQTSVEQAPMFSELPIDNPVIPKKKKRQVNDLQESFIYLMNKRNLTLAKIQAMTGIPWGTLMGWYNGQVSSNQLDQNLFDLWRVLKCNLAFLCFGVGDEDEEQDVDLMIKIGKMRKLNLTLIKDLKDTKEELERLKLYVKAHLEKSA